MVKLSLKICAQMENVAALECMEEETTFFCKLLCPCGYKTEEVGINIDSEYFILDHKRKNCRPKSVTFVRECEGCGRTGTIKIELPSDPFLLTAAQCEAGTHVPLMVFDCQGFEPTEFDLTRIPWIIDPVGFCPITDAEFEEEGWIEYIEELDLFLAVFDLEWVLER